jgi:hypothetical protein
MNKSILKSNYLTTQLNNLSETSLEFITEINNNNINSKTNNMIGGNKCSCIKAIDAFKKFNYDLALYILNDSNCCFTCKDDNGNTLLHHLVLYCSNNNNLECNKVLDKVLAHKDILDFINIQNLNGVTPILLAVMNNNESIANKLDLAGADKTIQDNIGNYLQTDTPESVNANKNAQSNQYSPSMLESPNDQICIKNIINLVVNEDKQDLIENLSSLNLTTELPTITNQLLSNNDYSATSPNVVNSATSANSDIFIEKLKHKLQDYKNVVPKNNELNNLAEVDNTLT